MNALQKEKYLQIINTIGSDKVETLYSIIGNERISIGTLRKIVTSDKIHNIIKCKESVSKVAQKLKVSRMTVYRYMKKK